MCEDERERCVRMREGGRSGRTKRERNRNRQGRKEKGRKDEREEG